MKKKNTKEFTCPFCSLLCDDINVVNTNNQYHVVNLKNKECLKKIESYNINKKSILYPKIFNKPSSLTDALNKSKLLIKDSNEIGILNLGVDMASTRSAINFASQINASFDHINSTYFFDNINVQQRTGYMSTTLAEVKNRSDVILLFGDKIIEKSLRLLERFIFPTSSLFLKKNKKKVFLIGQFSDKITKPLKNNPQVTNVKIKFEQIPQLLKIVNSKEGTDNINLSKSLINKLKLSLKKSRYITAIWTSSDFHKTCISDLIINSIDEFILDLNKNTRAACLPISGNHGDTTAIQTTTWLTGFPARIKNIDGFFKHDRQAYNVSKLIRNNEIDLAIYLNCLSLEKIQLNKKMKNIVIGHPGTKCSFSPDVFIPVGIPGIDDDGIMFRTDNVISLPVKSVRELNIPSLKQVLDKMV